jgi:hypothetical protein
MKTLAIWLCCGALALIPFTLTAQKNDPAAAGDIHIDISEDDLFSDFESVEAIEDHQDDELGDTFQQTSFGISAELSTDIDYQALRPELKEAPANRKDRVTGIIDGDLLLDVRWKYGIKAFSDLYFTYTALEDPDQAERRKTDGKEQHDIVVRELFADVNIARQLYFRLGKQTLKWGRGYFWNPTDLISIAKKDFNDIDARREGSYGLKMHIPFGTALNIYTFIDTTETERYDESAAAAKIEFLMTRRFEVSLSGWTKKDYRPVYGIDFAGYALSTQWRGEVSLTQGGNRRYLVQDRFGRWVDVDDPDEIIAEVVLGFTRTFDIGDIKNRFSLTGEGYYNPKGYEEDMLEIFAVRKLATPDSPDYYVPNAYGKYYAAVFTSFSHLFNTADLSLGFNGIGNLSDGSTILSASLRYTLGFDTAVTGRLSTYLGEENREYTIQGTQYQAGVSVATVF